MESSSSPPKKKTAFRKIRKKMSIRKALSSGSNESSKKQKRIDSQRISLLEAKDEENSLEGGVVGMKQTQTPPRPMNNFELPPATAVTAVTAATTPAEEEDEMEKLGLFLPDRPQEEDVYDSDVSFDHSRDMEREFKNAAERPRKEWKPELPSRILEPQFRLRESKHVPSTLFEASFVTEVEKPNISLGTSESSDESVTDSKPGAESTAATPTGEIAHVIASSSAESDAAKAVAVVLADSSDEEESSVVKALNSVTPRKKLKEPATDQHVNQSAEDHVDEDDVLEAAWTSVIENIEESPPTESAAKIGHVAVVDVPERNRKEESAARDRLNDKTETKKPGIAASNINDDVKEKQGSETVLPLSTEEISNMVSDIVTDDQAPVAAAEKPTDDAEEGYMQLKLTPVEVKDGNENFVELAAAASSNEPTNMVVQPVIVADGSPDRVVKASDTTISDAPMTEVSDPISTGPSKGQLPSKSMDTDTPAPAVAASATAISQISCFGESAFDMTPVEKDNDETAEHATAAVEKEEGHSEPSEPPVPRALFPKTSPSIPKTEEETDASKSQDLSRTAQAADGTVFRAGIGILDSESEDESESASDASEVAVKNILLQRRELWRMSQSKDEDDELGSPAKLNAEATQQSIEQRSSPEGADSQETKVAADATKSSAVLEKPESEGAVGADEPIKGQEGAQLAVSEAPMKMNDTTVPLELKESVNVAELPASLRPVEGGGEKRLEMSEQRVGPAGDVTKLIPFFETYFDEDAEVEQHGDEGIITDAAEGGHFVDAEKAKAMTQLPVDSSGSGETTVQSRNPDESDDSSVPAASKSGPIVTTHVDTQAQPEKNDNVGNVKIPVEESPVIDSGTNEAEENKSTLTPSSKQSDENKMETREERGPDEVVEDAVAPETEIGVVEIDNAVNETETPSLDSPDDVSNSIAFAGTSETVEEEGSREMDREVVASEEMVEETVKSAFGEADDKDDDVAQTSAADSQNDVKEEGIATETEDAVSKTDHDVNEKEEEVLHEGNEEVFEKAKNAVVEKEAEDGEEMIVTEGEMGLVATDDRVSEREKSISNASDDKAYIALGRPRELSLIMEEVEPHEVEGVVGCVKGSTDEQSVPTELEAEPNRLVVEEEGKAISKEHQNDSAGNAVSNVIEAGAGGVTHTQEMANEEVADDKQGADDTSQLENPTSGYVALTLASLTTFDVFESGAQKEDEPESLVSESREAPETTEIEEGVIKTNVESGSVGKEVSDDKGKALSDSDSTPQKRGTRSAHKRGGLLSRFLDFNTAPNMPLHTPPTESSKNDDNDKDSKKCDMDDPADIFGPKLTDESLDSDFSLVDENDSREVPVDVDRASTPPAPATPSVQDTVRSENHEKLCAFEAQRDSGFSDRFDAISSKWNASIDMLRIGVDETSRAERIMLASVFADQAYGEAMRAIYEDVFLDDDGNMVSNTMVGTWKQNRLSKERSVRDYTMVLVPDENAWTDSKHTPEARRGGMLTSLIDVQAKLAAKFNENASNSGDAKDIGAYRRELEPQLQAMEKQGKSIFNELHAAEKRVKTTWDEYTKVYGRTLILGTPKTPERSKGSSSPPKSPVPTSGGSFAVLSNVSPKRANTNEATRDLWLVEMRYRMAATLQQEAWEKSIPELMNIIESVVEKETERQNKLHEILLNVLPKQRRFFNGFASVHSPVLQELVERLVDQEVEDDIHKTIQRHSKSVQKKQTEHRSTILNRSRRNAGTPEAIKMEQLESPLDSKLLLSMMIVELRIISFNGAISWEKVLAVVTVDKCLHTFSMPPSTKDMTDADEVYQTLVPVPVEDVHDWEESGRTDILKELVPTDTVYLPNCSIKVFSGRVFEISETRSGRLRQTTTWKVTLRTKSRDETIAWVRNVLQKFTPAPATLLKKTPTAKDKTPEPKKPAAKDNKTPDLKKPDAQNKTKEVSRSDTEDETQESRNSDTEEKNEVENDAESDAGSTASRGPRLVEI